MFESEGLNICISVILAMFSGWMLRVAYARSKSRLSLEERELIEKEAATLSAQAETVDGRIEHNIRNGGDIDYWIKLSKQLRNRAKQKLAYLRLYNAG